MLVIFVSTSASARNPGWVPKVRRGKHFAHNALGLDQAVAKSVQFCGDRSKIVLARVDLPAGVEKRSDLTDLDSHAFNTYSGSSHALEHESSLFGDPRDPAELRTEPVRSALALRAQSFPGPVGQSTLDVCQLGLERSRIATLRGLAGEDPQTDLVLHSESAPAHRWLPAVRASADLHPFLRLLPPWIRKHRGR